MKDYYQILGLSPSASQEEIKKAYRKLSMKFHPDKNPGDPYFEQMFKGINEAYETLSNQAKKNNYDRSFGNRSKDYHKSTSEPPPPKKSPEIVSLEISNTSVSPGDSLTVSFQVKNAASVLINGKFRTSKLTSSVNIKIPNSWDKDQFQISLQAFNDELSTKSSVKVHIIHQKRDETSSKESGIKEETEHKATTSTSQASTKSKKLPEDRFINWFLYPILVVIVFISYLFLDPAISRSKASDPKEETSKQAPTVPPMKKIDSTSLKLYTHHYHYTGIIDEIKIEQLDPNSKELIPASIRKDQADEQLWGFINTRGEFVIPMKYSEAIHFSEGFAAVLKNGKWGFINEADKFVVPPIYDYVGSFVEGKAAVAKDGKLGFIYSNNKIVIPLIFSGGHYGMGRRNTFFSEGRAGVYDDDEDHQGYIDEYGNKASKFIYNNLTPFYNDSALVIWRYDFDNEYVEYLGYINREGFTIQIHDPIQVHFDVSSGYEYVISEDMTKIMSPPKSISESVEQIKQNMVYIDGGKFDRGCLSPYQAETLACESNESPIKQVSLSSFFISKFELTQAQWEAVMGYNPSTFKNCSNCPVENVSFDEVQLFIEKLNQLEIAKFRLPTEAEWEYAAKEADKYSWGNYFSGFMHIEYYGWYVKNSFNRPHPVGTRIPNKLGLYDMSGNVWEWCQDWYGERYYESNDTVNPKGPKTGTQRVFRGGSFNSSATNCRVSNRGSYLPHRKNNNIGFRLAMDPD